MESLVIRGFSPEAHLVDDAQRQNHSYLRQPVSFSKRPAYEELWATWQNCRLPNWDGYDAIAVDQDVYRNGYRFIEALPLDSSLPSIGVESDGHITFEWHRHAYWTFSVSVGPEGTLHYAGLFGAEDPRGSSPFFSEIPEAVLQLIRRACQI